MNSQIQKIQTCLRQGLCYSLRLPAYGGKEETMTTPRILGAGFLLAAMPLAGQSVLSAPDAPSPATEITIPENERDFPLHYLLRMHHYDAVLDLLPIAAGLDEQDREGRTLLTITARDETADAYDMVKALLERGADPKIMDGRGNAPLYYAAGAGTLSVVELLVDRFGADVNRASEDPETGDLLDYRTPVSSAAHNGRLRIIRFLESRGAEAVAEHMPALRMQARFQHHLAEMTDYLDDPPPDMTEAEILRARSVASDAAVVRALEDLGAPTEILDRQRLLNRTLRGIRDSEPELAFEDAYARAQAEVRSSTDQEAYLKASKRWEAILGGLQ